MPTSLGKVGIVNKGDYLSSVTYKAGDFVYHKGSTWLALANELNGIEPNNDNVNWKYLAKGFNGSVTIQSAEEPEGLMENDIWEKIL